MQWSLRGQLTTEEPVFAGLREERRLLAEVEAEAAVQGGGRRRPRTGDGAGGTAAVCEEVIQEGSHIRLSPRHQTDKDCHCAVTTEHQIGYVPSTPGSERRLDESSESVCMWVKAAVGDGTGRGGGDDDTTVI